MIGSIMWWWRGIGLQHYVIDDVEFVVVAIAYYFQWRLLIDVDVAITVVPLRMTIVETFFVIIIFRLLYRYKLLLLPLDCCLPL